MSRPRILVLCIALLGAAAPAFAQSDYETFERSVARTSEICPGHSRERTGPGLRAISISALRVLLAQDIVVCPDRRLDAAAPVVWYGRSGVYAWNPEVEGAGAALAERIGEMTRSEEFPVETLVWDAQGRPLREQTVPAFEPKPGIYFRVWRR